jgi:hypothetical protein
MHTGHHRCHPLQATKLDRKGGKNGRRASPSAPPSIVVRQPKKSWKTATHLPKFVRRGHRKGHPQLASRRPTPRVDSHREGRGSLEHRHRHMVVDGNIQTTGGQTEGEPVPKLTQLLCNCPTPMIRCTSRASRTNRQCPPHSRGVMGEKARRRPRQSQHNIPG